MVQDQIVSASIICEMSGLAGTARVLADRNAGRRAARVLRVRTADHADDEILNQLLRIERLTRRERGARGFALAALHAGIEAQQLIPAKLDRLADAVFLRIEHGLFQGRRRHDFLLVLRPEAFLTRMEREMQKTRHRVLHRAALRRAEGHRVRARRDQQRDDDRERAGHPRSGQQHEQRETERERAEQQRQAVPRSMRQTRGHVLRTTALVHEHRADEHDDRRDEDRAVEPRRVDRETVVEEDERHREDRAAGGRDVRLRDIRIARHDMMQIDEIALRDGQQIRPSVCAGRRRAAFAPVGCALEQGEREARHRKPQQRGDDKHGVHRRIPRQKSLQRRSES